MTLDHITPSFRLKLVRIASRISLDSAEDIVQDTLIHLYTLTTEPDSPDALTIYYCKRIALETKRRDAGKLARFSRQAKPSDDADCGAPSIERRMITRQKLDVLINKANPQMRQILDALADGDDCPTIAARLNISPASVRKAISRFRSTSR